jgi:hypothetical protein
MHLRSFKYSLSGLKKVGIDLPMVDGEDARYGSADSHLLGFLRSVCQHYIKAASSGVI